MEEKFPDLIEKRDEGLAFLLGYFEHGQCQWALSGEEWQDQWDSVRVAGLLIWEEDPANLPMTYEARRDDAREFCKEYTAWCNGECYWYRLDKFTVPDDFEGELDDVDAALRLGVEIGFQRETIDSCGGFIGHEFVLEEVREAIADADLGDVEFVLAGGCGVGIDVGDLVSEKKEVS